MSVFNAERDQWWPQHIAESAWLGHTPFAAWLVRVLEPAMIVELGTHRAVSYMAFCQANARLTRPAKCFAVDTWQGDEHAGRYDDSIFQNVRLLNEKYESFSTLLRCRFEEALGQFDAGMIDLLHIDGLHTYEAVSNDFHSWLPKMSEKGVILFHDTEVRDRNFGVWRLWQELSQQYPHFNFEHSFGLGVLVVGARVPSQILELCRSAKDRGALMQFRKVFEERGAEVISHYQGILNSEADRSFSGRCKQMLRNVWRGYAPMSLRRSLQKFR